MAKQKTSNPGQTQRPASRPIVPIIAVVVFVCAAAAYMLFGRGVSQSGVAAPSAEASSAASATGSTPTPVPFYGTFYPSQGHAHLDPGAPDDFKYNSNPPTSGPHREQFTDSFLSPDPLPSYVQVHLLEHGNVLLQYSCKCDDVAAALGAIAMDYDNRLVPPADLQPTAQDVQGAEEQGEAVIVAPYPSMHQKIALTAWTRVASLDHVDHAKINSFINSY
jgi:Protein of unknown function (DUF3105)